MYKLIIISILFFFLSCKNDVKKVEELTQLKHMPSEMGTDVEILYSDSAMLKMKLKAPSLLRYDGNNPYTEFPKGIEVFFYGEEEKVETQLKAGYAVDRQGREFMEARKDVVVINEKGDKLNTEHLLWDKKRRMIFSKAFVRITTADEVIFGDGLEANESFTKYKITKIKGTINLKDTPDA
jgi:LPS export ABC transporter protein LptC